MDITTQSAIDELSLIRKELLDSLASSDVQNFDSKHGYYLIKKFEGTLQPEEVVTEEDRVSHVEGLAFMVETCVLEENKVDQNTVMLFSQYLRVLYFTLAEDQKNSFHAAINYFKDYSIVHPSFLKYFDSCHNAGTPVGSPRFSRKSSSSASPSSSAKSSSPNSCASKQQEENQFILFLNALYAEYENKKTMTKDASKKKIHAKKLEFLLFFKDNIKNISAKNPLIIPKISSFREFVKIVQYCWESPHQKINNIYADIDIILNTIKQKNKKSTFLKFFEEKSDKEIAFNDGKFRFKLYDYDFGEAKLPAWISTAEPESSLSINHERSSSCSL